MQRRCIICGKEPSGYYVYPRTLNEARKWQDWANTYSFNVPVGTLRKHGCVCRKHLDAVDELGETDDKEEDVVKARSVGGMPPSIPGSRDIICDDQDKRSSVSFTGSNHNQRNLPQCFCPNSEMTLQQSQQMDYRFSGSNQNQRNQPSQCICPNPQLTSLQSQQQLRKRYRRKERNQVKSALSVPRILENEQRSNVKVCYCPATTQIPNLQYDHGQKVKHELIPPWYINQAKQQQPQLQEEQYQKPRPMMQQQQQMMDQNCHQSRRYSETMTGMRSTKQRANTGKSSKCSNKKKGPGCYCDSNHCNLLNKLLSKLDPLRSQEKQTQQPRLEKRLRQQRQQQQQLHQEQPQQEKQLRQQCLQQQQLHEQQPCLQQLHQQQLHQQQLHQQQPLQRQQQVRQQQRLLSQQQSPQSQQSQLLQQQQSQQSQPSQYHQQQFEHYQNQRVQCSLRVSNRDQEMQCPSLVNQQQRPGRPCQTVHSFSGTMPANYPGGKPDTCECGTTTSQPKLKGNDEFGQKTKRKVRKNCNAVNVLIMGAFGQKDPDDCGVTCPATFQPSPLTEICLLESGLTKENERAVFPDIDLPNYSVCRAPTTDPKIDGVDKETNEQDENCADVLVLGKNDIDPCPCKNFSNCPRNRKKDEVTAECCSTVPNCKCPEAQADYNQVIAEQRARIDEIEILMAKHNVLQQIIQCKVDELQCNVQENGKKPTATGSPSSSPRRKSDIQQKRITVANDSK